MAGREVSAPVSFYPLASEARKTVKNPAGNGCQTIPSDSLPVSKCFDNDPKCSKCQRRLRLGSGRDDRVNPGCSPKFEPPGTTAAYHIQSFTFWGERPSGC